MTKLISLNIAKMEEHQRLIKKEERLRKELAEILDDNKYNFFISNVSCNFIRNYICNYMISNGRYEEYLELKNFDKANRKTLYKLLETLDIPKIPPVYFDLPDNGKK